MINRIDIRNFGCFSDFSWQKKVRNKKGHVVDLKKLNIIYGRNYTGKTTLSRLVRSLQTKELPNRYENPEFIVRSSEGDISSDDIGSHTLDVRVFNKDFIDDHLSFLVTEDGDIEPFATLGRDNSKIEKQIREKERELGSEERKSGLIYWVGQKKLAWETKAKEAEAEKCDLNAKLSDKANKDIKRNRLFDDVTYDIRRIKRDIELAIKEKVQPISPEIETGYRAMLKQEPIPKPSGNPSINLRLSRVIQDASAILSKEIRPTNAIQELLDDSILQSWVNQGVEIHRDKRTSCGFCGNPISSELMHRLDEHFSKEPRRLEESLNEVIDRVGTERKKLKEIPRIAVSEIYPDLRDELSRLNRLLDERAARCQNSLNEIERALEERKRDLFNPAELVNVTDDSESLEKALLDLDCLISKHEEQSKNLEKYKSNARAKYRLGLVSRFLVDIDYTKRKKSIESLDLEASRLKAEYEEKEAELSQLRESVQELKLGLKDESRGAELVNGYLSHHFGHDGLRLVAIADENRGQTGVRFEIQRGDQKAYNLSEGECGLLAFSYFVAKLDDLESQDKDLIIYIDDPVSSLDSDHIFFVFSLIQGLIASAVVNEEGKRVSRYRQLFLSTHNLEFLKFLKRLDRPPAGGNEHFLLARRDSGHSVEVMPFYLRQYVTEFHYLFDQICACADTDTDPSDHRCFFSFGNNLRKFLEVYLFFKFPFCEQAQGDYNKRIDRFFDEDPATEPMVTRLTNELSHLNDAFDRSVKPIDQSEISKMALFVLRKMSRVDPQQYQDLLQATDRPDPLSEEHGNRHP